MSDINFLEIVDFLPQETRMEVYRHFRSGSAIVLSFLSFVACFPTAAAAASSAMLLRRAHVMDKYAGYMDYSIRSSYANIHADFTVSTITCGGEAAFWDGIGADGYLAQTGIDAECLDGTPSYYAFAQFWAGGHLVAAPPINNTVAPGDDMSATTHNDGNGYFTTTLVDRTRGWTSTHRKYIGANHAHTAEVFVENSPSSGNNLADFGSVKFSNVTVGRSAMGRTRPTKFNMVDGSGIRKATTSRWDSAGRDFTVTWDRRK